jgi:hypothetical protein
MKLVKKAAKMATQGMTNAKLKAVAIPYPISIPKMIPQYRLVAL